MDHSILIWNIASERAQLAIEAAEVFKLHNSDSPFPTDWVLFFTKVLVSNCQLERFLVLDKVL